MKIILGFALKYFEPKIGRCAGIPIRLRPSSFSNYNFNFGR